MHATVALFATLLPTAVAFLPAPNNAIAVVRLSMSKPDSETIDIEHAKFCADHFGECSLEDMERMRNGEQPATILNVSCA